MPITNTYILFQRSGKKVVIDKMSTQKQLFKVIVSYMNGDWESNSRPELKIRIDYHFFNTIHNKQFNSKTNKGLSSKKQNVSILKCLVKNKKFWGL